MAPRMKSMLRGCYDDFMEYLDSSEDTDRVFSYYTKQQVLYLDSKLGLTFYALSMMIAAYIVGYMFIYQKGYLEYEQAKGAVATHVSGDAIGISSGKKASRYFSTEDLTYPGLENGNVFVATRQIVHRQMRGICEDPNIACVQDSDCSPGGDGKCGVNGLCIESSWCDQDKKPEVYALDTANVQIWARSTIQFVKIAAERVFSTGGENPMPQAGLNVFTVSELLMKCEPLPVRYEEVAELGAIIEIQFIWECSVKSKAECKPTVKARRLDSVFDPDHIGFGFSYPEYIDGDHRLRNEVRGVRLFFRTTGTGWKGSISATITKASMGASLFSIAQIIADLLMTKIFARRKKYNARKYENTPDFGDYMEMVEEKKASQVTDEFIEEEERRVQKKETDWMRKLDEEDV